MKLVIIDSNAKRQPIRKLLTQLYGSGVYKVIASQGHIRDLPPDELGVDVSQGFQPRYTITKGKAKTVKLLSQHVAEADAIYIANDPDREGEAIAWHIVQVTRPTVPVFRVSFNEITRSAIKQAFDHPRPLNMDLVASREARRVLDRLVGYKISPALWRGLDQAKLSAGRVQSIALGLVVTRQRAIEAFQPQAYWSIRGQFRVPTGQFEGKLIMWAGQPWTHKTFQSEIEAQVASDVLTGMTYTVQKIATKLRPDQPPVPFITSTLLLAAASHLQFSPKQTMTIARKLYEAGFITYMHTASPAVSDDASNGTRTLIQAWYGNLYLPKQRRVFEATSNSHQCIRPTDMTRDKLSEDYNEPLIRLYRLIWARFMASQMADAIYEEKTIYVAGGSTLFMTQHRLLTFDGFLRVSPYGETPGESSSDEVNKTTTLPVLAEDQSCHALTFKRHNHTTRPPAPYTQASLIKALEKYGIGRPSTYSLMISTIHQRKLVVLKRGQLAPTLLGERVYRFLETHFPLVVNIDFTKLMEDALDRIALGELETRQFLQVFWDRFQPFIQAWEHVAPNPKTEPTFIGEVCPVCGVGQIVIKPSRKGRFLSCQRYPACKYARNLQAPAPLLIGRRCPDCGSQLCLRARREGCEKFIACTNYPACKHTEAFQLEQQMS